MENVKTFALSIVAVVFIFSLYSLNEGVGNSADDMLVSGPDAIIATEKVILDIAKEQDIYYQKYGQYKQIKEDRTKPDYEKQKRVFDESFLPVNLIRVDQYDGPCGLSAKIVMKYSDRIEHIGVGDCAQEYTYTDFDVNSLIPQI